MATDTKMAAKVKSALVGLVLEEPFFGVLALRLKMVEDATCKTAWTDGVSLGYNPAFMAGLSPAEIKGVLCHEVLHCSNGHPWRQDGREGRKWNTACDHAINPIIRQAGMSLPDGCLEDIAYKGLSAEAIYSSLPPDPPGDNGQGQGNTDNGGKDPDPGNSGEVRPAPSDTNAEAMEAEWQAATMQAAQQAKMAGQLPAGLDRLLKEIAEPACRDLVAALLEWANRAAKDDYTWRKPNSRYVPQGIYLPSLYSESVPPIVMAVDTSGSIDTDTLSSYIAAGQRVLEEVKPEVLITIACDAKIQAIAEYAPGDTIDGKFPGGGGTRFAPVFEELEQTGEELAGVIYLTDLYGSFPDNPPDMPVLWVVRDADCSRIKPPFGEVIYLP